MGAVHTYIPSVRPTRRASAQSYAQCGYVHDKKFRSSLFKGLQVQGRARFALQTTQFPLETVRFPQGTVVASPQKAKSPLPKISSARGSPMPAGIGRRGRIARASPMDEVGWMPTSSIKIERGQHFRFTLSVGTTWAGTALTILDLFPP